jgi:hypothetical protein
MTDYEDEDVYSAEVTRRNRRRRQTVAGVAGLATILGVGAYFVTSELTAKDKIAPEPAAIAPVVTAAGPSAVDTPDASPSVEPSASTAPSRPAPSTSASPTPMTVRQHIDAAKGTAAKAKNQVRHPLPPIGKIAEVNDVTVKDTGSFKTGGTLRVVSARGDLTGQRELSLVADDGEKVGDAKCTQSVRFAEGMPAVEKPSLMICWRTSDDRSVFTVAVAKTGRPSAADSVAAIDKRWAQLG